jgi:hypothetical protein
VHQKASRHVTIAVSGFLSKDSPHKNEWSSLSTHLGESSVAAYALNWEAKKWPNIYAIIAKASLYFALIGGLTAVTRNAVLARAFISALGFGQDIHKLFSSAK